MLESKFKTKQREDFEGMGWKFIQLSAGGGVPQGFCDTLCLAPNGYHCFVEWKQRRSSKKQPLQEYWVNKLNDMGHDAFFVHKDNVNEWRQTMLQKGKQRGSK